MAKQNKTNDWKERELGALWLKESEKGKFLSGYVTVDGEEVSVVVYKNNFYEQDKKDGKNSPYYRVYKSLPKEGQKQTPKEQPEDDHEDVPF